MTPVESELRTIKQLLAAILASLIILVLYVTQASIIPLLAPVAVIFLIYFVVSQLYRWSQL